MHQSPTIRVYAGLITTTIAERVQEKIDPSNSESLLGIFPSFCMALLVLFYSLNLSKFLKKIIGYNLKQANRNYFFLNVVTVS
ncbi:hypothetical protein AQUCO_00201111v1 [Aquilegia coerulea]|uniref:Uncharacterized protein n=1 Tax=Aquilegia coerulea TaxID=218851 RepID=A0A2G5F6H2_AQUCA|nr:hypothetical protein AQUCO_00201111v1 [Aquilegia coerulea]